MLSVVLTGCGSGEESPQRPGSPSDLDTAIAEVTSPSTRNVIDTHERTYHSLTTCVGEMSGEEVGAVGGKEDVILRKPRHTFDNGSIGLWLPRDLDAPSPHHSTHHRGPHHRDDHHHDDHHRPHHGPHHHRPHHGPHHGPHGGETD